MNFTVILEVAIGLIFVWVLLALITSSVQEWISQLLKWRPAMLEEAIQNILADNTLAKEFYDHPLIKSLHSSGGDRRPSAIPNKQFASVVFDLIIKAGITPEKTLEIIEKAGTEESPAEEADAFILRIRESLHNLSQVGDVKKFKGLAGALDALLVDVSTNVDKADTAIATARQRVEGWFEDAMVRLSGSYKRRTYVFSIIIGIVLAAAMNADSIAIANHLWRDPIVRETLAVQAEQFNLPADVTNQDAQQAATQYYEQLQSLSQETSFPLGWTEDNLPKANDPLEWLVKVIGILLSGMAAAQGAPFWFDIMRKLLDLRGGGGSSGAAKAEEESKS